MLHQKRQLQKYLPYILAGGLLLLLLMMAKSEKILLRSASRVQQEEVDLSKYFYIPPWAANVSDVREKDYDELRSHFIKRYSAEIYQTTGKAFEIPDDWNNPYFAGASNVTEEAAQVLLWGGLARAPGATTAIVAAVLCHEVGHILGGEPRQSSPLPEWSSSEGQSDFFAAVHCLPWFFLSHPDVKITIEEEVQQVCKDDLMCEKITQTGLDFLRFLQKYSYREYEPVSVLKKEVITSELVRDRYPTHQCRLDTFVEAAQCSSSVSCEPAACWFKK